MDPLHAAAQANPAFKLGVLPFGQPGAALSPAGLGPSPIPMVRSQAPGGALLEHVQSEAVLWFEQLYRVLPPVGIFGASPQKPVQFELGSFKVPQSMVLIVLDYAFDIYRFSGAAAGDYVPLEDNRLSTQVGWDIVVDNKRPANFQFQIIPQPQSQSQQTFTPSQIGISAAEWKFQQARAQLSQSTAVPALSMMPQRKYRPGRLPISNMYVARPNTTLSVTCNIINQIPIPLAFFEADVMGTLVPQELFDAYQAAAAPIGDPIRPRIPGSSP